MTFSLLLAAVLAAVTSATAAPPPPQEPAPVAVSAHVTALSERAARPARTQASGVRFSYGKEDARGCARLVLRVDGRKITSIPSHRQACSRLAKRVDVGSRTYFEWAATWTDGTGRKAVERRRSDLWVSDGSRTGTREITTLKEQSGRRVPTCESRWARAGFRAIGGAQWCWDDATDTWVSGSIAILIDGTLARYLPVPRMHDFRLAGRRIVTTGEDSRGREPWVHDGRMTGIDLRPGPKGSNPHDLVDLGKTVQFVANDGNGRGLWVSDGTVAGTRLVRRLP